MGWPEELERIAENLKGPPSEPGKATDGIALASDMLGLLDTSARVGTGLNILGAVATGIGQYQESTAQSTLFKGADAALAGMMDWAIGSATVLTPAGVFPVPHLAVADYALGAVTKELLGVELSLAGTGNGAAHALTTLVDGLISGETEGMENFHTKALNGDYTIIIQGYAMIGEALKQADFHKPIDVDELLNHYSKQQLQVPALRLGE